MTGCKEDHRCLLLLRKLKEATAKDKIMNEIITGIEGY